MKIKKILFILGICFLLISCGKKEKQTENSHSKWEVDKAFTEEALLYRNSATNRVEYFDYETGYYGPLCAKLNCLHNGLECMAYYMGEKASRIGRLRDQWYYVKIKDDGTQVFCSCDLDGANEKEIGEFSHTIGYQIFYWEDSCIFLTEDSAFDEESEEWLGDISGIYQYHLDTGEAEVLCPEKGRSKDDPYRLYGQYQDSLIYGEATGEGFELRILDLKTHDIQTPLENICVFGGIVSEEFLMCYIKEGEAYQVIELNLESGERKEVMGEVEEGMRACWSSDLKLITLTNYPVDPKDFRYQVYQYTGEGECVLVREGTRETYLEPVMIKDDRIIGRYEDAGSNRPIFELAVIGKEDFLAGKSNWEVLQY